MHVRMFSLSKVGAAVVVGMAVTLFAQQSPSAALKFSSYLLSPQDRINAVQVALDGSAYVAGVSPPGFAGGFVFASS